MKSRRATFLLWTVIALGIVPAVVTGHISPFSGFGPRFGLEVDEMTFLPWSVCLLLFLLGVTVCMAQRRYILLPLLLPWLALLFYPANQLTFQLPTPWEAQEKHYENERLAREYAEPPDTEVIRTRIEHVAHTDTSLFHFERQALLEELDYIVSAIGARDPGSDKRAVAISGQIAVLRAQIEQANAQIRSVDQALRNVSVISWAGLGLVNRILGDKLSKGREKVVRHRNRLESRRNALRVELTAIRQAQSRTEGAFTALRDLDARVTTYIWASEAYGAWQVSLVYKALCLGVLLVLIWQFPLGSWVYLSLLGASLATALLYVEAPSAYRLWLVFQFVILSLGLRILRLLLLENAPLIRRQPGSFLIHTLRKALIYYLPFIVLLALGVAASIHVNRLVDEQLYSLDIMQGADPGAPRRYNIDRAIGSYFEAREKAALEMLDGLSGRANVSTQQVADSTLRFYEDNVAETLPEIDPALAPPGCGGFLPWLFRTPQCAERSIKKPLNDAYTDERNEQRDSLARATQAYAASAGNNAEMAIQFAREDLSDTFHDMERAIKKQLNLLYSVFDVYAWVSLLVLIVIVLKSFMYIFARVFFASHADGERMIQFEPAAEPRQSGGVREVSDTLELTPDMGEQMYVSKRYDFANAPPDEVTPQAHKAFFSRFWRGAWHMNRIWIGVPGNRGVTSYRRLPADEHIVVWTLKPGDAVIFSWKQFVGMSEGVGIRTQYSWQLASLVFGRMFFVVASVAADSPAEGTLLLAARGSDGIDSAANPSNSPDQLLAWQTTTRFEMHANLSFRNVYRSGVQIRARDSDLAVMHLNARRQRSGAVRFLTYFLLPV